jgi:hypothetical protein
MLRIPVYPSLPMHGDQTLLLSDLPVRTTAWVTVLLPLFSRVPLKTSWTGSQSSASSPERYDSMWENTHSLGGILAEVDAGEVGERGVGLQHGLAADGVALDSDLPALAGTLGLEVRLAVDGLARAREVRDELAEGDLGVVEGAGEGGVLLAPAARELDAGDLGHGGLVLSDNGRGSGQEEGEVRKEAHCVSEVWWRGSSY